MDGRVRSSGQGLRLGLVLGVIGAVVSGYLFTAIGATGLTGSNLYSMFVAIIGAVVVLLAVPRTRQFGLIWRRRRLSWRTSRVLRLKNGPRSWKARCWLAWR